MPGTAVSWFFVRLSYPYKTTTTFFCKVQLIVQNNVLLAYRDTPLSFTRHTLSISVFSFHRLQPPFPTSLDLSFFFLPRCGSAGFYYCWDLGNIPSPSHLLSDLTLSLLVPSFLRSSSHTLSETSSQLSTTLWI